MDKELLNEIEKIKKIVNYMEILDKHHFFDDTDAFSNTITNTFAGVVSAMEQTKNLDPQKDLNKSYDMLRILANLCLFCDCVTPVTRKYNPSDEDKKQFLEFIGYKEDKDE